MSRLVAAAAIVAATLLAGCTTPAAVRSGPAQARTGGAAPALPSPTPTGPAAPFAKVIAKYQKTWQDYDAGTDACNKAADGRTADDVIKAMNCVKSAQVAAQAARAATDALNGLGTPPAEIQALLTRTLAALAPLRDSGAEAACQDAGSDPCRQAVDKIDVAVSPLADVLDSWDTYINP